MRNYVKLVLELPSFLIYELQIALLVVLTYLNGCDI